MTWQETTLAIVGGGAAGVATFIAAVRRRAASCIYVIDPRQIGPGVAFGSSDNEVLCNTSVDIMSVVAGNPSDFLDYLISSGYKATPDSYVPRRWMGEYLTHRFHYYRAIAIQSGIDVIHLPYQFQSLRIDGHRRYTIRFTDSSIDPLTATDVVFCTGHGAPRIPDVLKEHHKRPTFISCPYPEAEMMERIPVRSRVLVIGSKLSAADAAILLCREGHQVTMVSSSGQFTAVRGRFIRNDRLPLDNKFLESIISQWDSRDETANSPVFARAFLKFVIRTLSEYSDTPSRVQFSYATRLEDRLREEIAIAERGDNVWQDLAVSFVDAINDFYVKNKNHRMHRDFKNLVYRYIAGIALPNAKKLLRLIEEGRLVVRRGELKHVQVPDGDEESWLVNWGEGFQRFRAVVVAAGFHFPNVVFNESGELEIDAEGQRTTCCVDISDRINMTNPYRDEGESIWFVGPPAHTRVPIPNALFIVAPFADLVVSELEKLSSIQQLSNS
jgi:uncharacterized NAD(P)/FAD-binding protein YdhS